MNIHLPQNYSTMAHHVTHLELYRPLTYVKDNSLEPFAIESVKEVDGELLFVFGLDAERVKDGGGNEYFTRLLEAGFELYDGDIHDEITMPRGKYYFTQERALLKKDAVAAMAGAVEEFAGSDGRKLENKFYLRYVYEDGSAVTQLFWPVVDEERI
jgi:hypothetical protein